MANPLDYKVSKFLFSNFFTPYFISVTIQKLGGCVVVL